MKRAAQRAAWAPVWPLEQNLPHALLITLSLSEKETSLGFQLLRFQRLPVTVHRKYTKNIWATLMMKASATKSR